MGHSRAPAGVVLVADGGPAHGLGHIHRSTALAAALATRGIVATCYAHGAAGPLERDGVRWQPLESGVGRVDVLILDSYELALSDLGATPGIVVALHDHLDPPAEAALVISAAADPAQGDDRHLYGPRYACVRPAFWGLPLRTLGPVERVLVTTGGGEGAGVGAPLAEAVRDALPGVQVVLALGSAGGEAPPGVESLPPQPSLAAELIRADLVVTAAGQTMLEAAAVGAPTIAIPIVANQVRQAERLGAVGAVRVGSAGPAAVAAAAQELAADEPARRLLSQSAQHAVDGYGALRIAFRIGTLAQPPADGT